MVFGGYCSQGYVLFLKGLERLVQVAGVILEVIQLHVLGEHLMLTHFDVLLGLFKFKGVNFNQSPSNFASNNFLSGFVDSLNVMLKLLLFGFKSLYLVLFLFVLELLLSNVILEPL